MSEFEELLEANRRRLWAIARSYARPADAEDLFQEIVLQLWRGRQSFDGKSAASTWVYRVALNTAFTWRRRASTQSRRAIEEPIGAELPGHSGGRDEVAILREFLGTLDETDRALMLLYLEDMSYREMAEVMGITENNVGVRLSRLKAAFTGRYLGA